MSAGEQKIFLLLEKIFRAEKFSLILIDELDLLLHDSAMKNLINVVSERSTSHNLQVIFTTHRESILDLSDVINIRHIFSTREKTLCFSDTKPDAIHRLTGNQNRLIEVFVEDDLTVTIVKKIAAQLSISRHVSIQRFGAAINCFTILAGLLLSGETCDNSIFVLDGDVYRTQIEQENRLKSVLTGDDQNAKTLRQSSLHKIKCLNLPANTKPEKYIHTLITNLNSTGDGERDEIIEVAKQIVAVDESHKYVNDIINRFDWDRNTGLSKIIDLISSTQDWNNYVADIKTWLKSRLSLVQEVESQEG